MSPDLACEVNDIREQIKLGLPWGSEGFIMKIESALGIVAKRLSPGRKPKK